LGWQEPTLSELVQTEEGRAFWRKKGFTWAGNFFLANGHPCWRYLKRHLQEKGIVFAM